MLSKLFSKMATDFNEGVPTPASQPTPTPTTSSTSMVPPAASQVSSTPSVSSGPVAPGQKWMTLGGQQVPIYDEKDWGWVEENKYGNEGDWQGTERKWRLQTPYEGIFGQPEGQNWNLRDPNTMEFWYKSGDKEASIYKYNLQNGKYIPTYHGKRYWDTNNSSDWEGLGKVALAAVGGAMMGPSLQGLGTAVEAGTMPTLSQISSGINMFNTASGGQIPGLREAGLVAGGINSATGLMNNSFDTLGDVFKAGRDAYNIYNKGTQMFNMFSGPDERAGTGYMPRTGATDDMMAGNSSNGYGVGNLIGDIGSLIFGGAGGGRTGLMDLYGAYKGSKEARDEAFRLQNLYNDAQARRQPVLDRLNESYINPDSFYNSNQWKGLSSVYQNSLDRNAAKTGRLANPTDREVALQAHAMKALEDYRGGLRQQAQILNPDNYINPFMRGSTREAGAANPYFAMGGRGSVGAPGTGGRVGDIYGTLSSLQKVFGGQIPTSILRALGLDGSNPNYGSPEGGFESDYPTSDLGGIINSGYGSPEGGFESDYPMSDPSWGDPYVSYGDYSQFDNYEPEQIAEYVGEWFDFGNVG